MRARQLIENNTAFGPETLKLMGQVFEDAWNELAPRYAGRPTDIEAARVRLAHVVLASAVDQIDATDLKASVLRGFEYQGGNFVRSD